MRIITFITLASTLCHCLESISSISKLEKGPNNDQSPAIGFIDTNFCLSSSSLIRDSCGVTFSAVENLNHKIRDPLKDLVTTDFFRYYRLDLYGYNCPFLEDDGVCGNVACAVYTVDDEEDLPEVWRSSNLGKFAKDSVSTIEDDEHEPDHLAKPLQSSCVSNNEWLSDDLISSSIMNRDYCIPEDESAGSPGVFVSLVDNPERYTGYAGPHANNVWKAVYQENCFGYWGDNNNAIGSSNAQLNAAGSKLAEVINGPPKYEGQNYSSEGQCFEQRLFYRVVSGMHASVSTHLSFDHLDKATGIWGPNLESFMSRVGNYPERLSNMYFNYALLSRAVSKLRYYVDDLTFCRHNDAGDMATRKQLLMISKLAVGSDNLFNETTVFSTPEGLALKEEFRNRFRKVSSLMECVGCDRCRLWGKVQITGYGTALKILFELPERPEDNPQLSREVLSNLRRSELVALINTFDRLSKSIQIVEFFRQEANEINSKPFEEDFSNLPRSNSTSHWDPEFKLVWEALKFILRSYVELPYNLWELFIYYSSIYWNKLVGREEILAEQWKKNHAQVRLDL